MLSRKIACPSRNSNPGWSRPQPVRVTDLSKNNCELPICEQQLGGSKEIMGFSVLLGVFPYFFLSCKTNAKVKLAKTGHGPHSSKLVFISVIMLFCVLFVCKCVLYYCHRVTMCTVLLPPGDNQISVNKYIT
jgi:hypothetical protein